MTEDQRDIVQHAVMSLDRAIHEGPYGSDDFFTELRGTRDECQRILDEDDKKKKETPPWLRN